MAWSYQCVLAIGGLPVSQRTKNILLPHFRVWLGNNNEIRLSEFALNHLVQSNGHLMPFYRFAARYNVNRWYIPGLGKKGQDELINAFRKGVDA